MRDIIRPSLVLLTNNLKARYRGTWAGFIWVSISPMMTFAVQAFVFQYVLRLQIENYYLFLLTGLMPWVFFAQTLEMSVNVFHYLGRLLKVLQLHPLTSLLAQILDNFLNMLIAFVILFLPFAFEMHINLSPIGMYVLALVPLILFVTGLALFLAILQVYFLDLKFVLGFVLQILFFLTPVFYPESFLEQRLKWAVAWNPLVLIFRPLRVYHNNYSSVSHFTWDLLLSFSLGVVMLLASIILWERKKGEIFLKV